MSGIARILSGIPMHGTARRITYTGSVIRLRRGEGENVGGSPVGRGGLRLRELLLRRNEKVCAEVDHITLNDFRPDCSLVRVPTDCVGYVMGDRRKTLSNLEQV